MRLRRMRYTVRQLMFVVAVVSVLLGVATWLVRRRASFLRRAEEYAKKASQETLRGMYAGQLPFFAISGLPPIQEKMRDAHYELMDYYSGQARKSRRAAGRPWVPIETDPPPPAWPKGVPTALPDKVHR